MGIRNKERALAFVEMRLDGHTLQEIGDKFGVTREYVRQVLSKISNPDYTPDIPFEEMTIGQRLKALRKTRRLTQKEFCEPLGITSSYYSVLENGKCPPSESLLRLVALHYSVGIDWIKHGKEETETG